MKPQTALSPELIAQMKSIAFRTKFLVSETFAGSYESAFKGRGMQFEEVRPYFPGDDIRTIDWNVTARTGLPHIKLFREERELTLMFIVDVSASMRFGTVKRFKSEAAAEVAAILAHTALKSNDKVGLIIFSDKVEHYIPPKKGRAHIWRVIRDILTYDSKATHTDITAALNYLNRVAKRKLVAFLISDFQCEGYENALRRTAKHHDVIAMTISDPKENDMPRVGLVTLKDMESGEIILMDTGDRDVRRRFDETIRREREVRKNTFNSCGVSHIAISTDGSTVEPIVQFFRKRERRR